MATSFAEKIRQKCFVDEGIILQDYDNLIFQKSFWVYGYDYEAEDDSYINLVNDYLGKIFAGIPSGWVLSENVVVNPDNLYLDQKKNYFKNKLLSFIDREDEYFYTRPEAKFFTSFKCVTFTFAPQQQVLQKLGKLYSSTNKEKNTIENLENYLREYRENLDLYIRLLQKAMRIEPMSNDETVSYLNYLTTGIWINFKLPTKTYIDIKYLLTESFDVLTDCKVGDMHFKIVSIDNYFPDSANPLVLERLMELGFHLRWNSKFYFYRKQQAQNELRSLIKMHDFNTTELPTSTDGEAKFNLGHFHLSDQANQALAQTYTGTNNFGRYTNHIILMGKDAKELEIQASKVKTLLIEMDFKAREEKHNVEEAFFSSIDGDIVSDQRRSLISTENYANLMQLSGFWSGEKYNPSPLYPKRSNPLFIAHCDNFRRFNVNIFDKDLGHFLVVGRAGYGKSTLINKIIASHFRYENAQVFGLDCKGSMSVLCHAMNGNHYDIGNDKNAVFQPLAEVDTPEGKDFAMDWIETLCNVNNLAITVDISMAIKGSIETLAELPVEYRTLEYLQHHARALNLELSNLIGLYVGNESLQSSIFSASIDNIKFSNFNVFETSELIHKGEKILVPAYKYIFHKITQRLDGRPTLIMIEEGDTFWKNPLLASRLDEWLKTLRKSNVAVGLVALQVESINESPIKSTLLNQCATKFYTGNSELTKADVRKAYKDLGLTDKQLDILKEATPKRQYYLVNSYASRLFNFDLDYLEINKAFMASTSTDDVKLAKQMKAQYKTEFANQWLKHKGINYISV